MKKPNLNRVRTIVTASSYWDYIFSIGNFGTDLIKIIPKFFELIFFFRMVANLVQFLRAHEKKIKNFKIMMMIIIITPLLFCNSFAAIDSY